MESSETQQSTPISASPTNAIDAMKSELASAAATPDHQLPKAKLIAERQLRKQIQEQQKQLRKPITRGEVYQFLSQIDNGLTRMDKHVSNHQNAFAFLMAKGVFTQAEFDEWEKQQQAKIEAAKQAAAAQVPAEGAVDGTPA